jgi:tetratricopeptide (TPR) repeat protein
MNLRHILLGVAAVLTAAAACGCEPKRETRAWVNPLDAMEAALPQDPKAPDYILRRMEFGRVALMLGCDMRAKPRLMEAFEHLGDERDNTAAALTTEQLKFYRGETYERAMLATYMGMLEYRAGEFNNARILFMRALSADRAAVVKKETPAVYGEDFGLAYFWVARAFAQLGDADQCAIALRKAAARIERRNQDKESIADAKDMRGREEDRQKGEAWAFETFGPAAPAECRIDGVVSLADARTPLARAPAALPGAAATNPVALTTADRSEFFSPAYQAQANAVLTIELGRPPFKTLSGLQNERTEINRACVRPRTVRVYVDGHFAGEAFEVLDLWDQAATQDRIDAKDAAQTGKALTKTLLRYTPYVGSLASHWNVQGDLRSWTTLPGKVFVYAGRISPGPHTVRLEMYDCAGLLLPRWTNTWHGLVVPSEGEAAPLLQARCEADNTLPPADVARAMEAGAKPATSYDF